MLNSNNVIDGLGKRIQEARLLQKMTQDVLAEKCNVTAKHISAIECGNTLGSISLLVNICNILNITADSLLVDSLNKSNKDSIIPLEKHDILLKYTKLSKDSQIFINTGINLLYDQQNNKS